ncbi:hypothetical protein ACJD0Z_07225 [Flavobacteriaceae bacterium M23B6Z8]
MKVKKGIAVVAEFHKIYLVIALAKLSLDLFFCPHLYGDAAIRYHEKLESLYTIRFCSFQNSNSIVYILKI